MLSGQLIGIATQVRQFANALNQYGAFSGGTPIKLEEQEQVMA
jgi:hypothetical protein